MNSGFVIQLGASVSHLTGDVSHAAVHWVSPEGEPGRAWLLLVMASAGFVFGAATAGWFIHHPTLEPTRPYGRSILAIGLLLLASHFLLPWTPAVAVAVGGCACGLQNALATRYRGMVLRTTHLTGLLTDLGISLGMRLRGHDIQMWKIAVPALLVAAFVAGSAFGAMLVLWWHLPFLPVLAPIYLIAGAAWWIAKRW